MHTTLGKVNLSPPQRKPKTHLTSGVYNLLSGSFKLEACEKVIEYESRYCNPTTQQDASRTSPLKNIYVKIRKVFNDKPIIFPPSRLELVDLQKSELEKRSFILKLGFLSYLKPL